MIEQCNAHRLGRKGQTAGRTIACRQGGGGCPAATLRHDHPDAARPSRLFEHAPDWPACGIRAGRVGSEIDTTRFAVEMRDPQGFRFRRGVHTFRKEGAASLDPGYWCGSFSPLKHKAHCRARRRPAKQNRVRCQGKSGPFRSDRIARQHRAATLAFGHADLP